MANNKQKRGKDDASGVVDKPQTDKLLIVISVERAEKIIQRALLKKAVDNWMPDIDPLDWLALQVAIAYKRKCKKNEATGD